MAVKLISDSKINSLSEFIAYVMKWQRLQQNPVAYRGQSFYAWPSIPKVFRPDVGMYDHEKEAVRDLVSIHPQEFRDDETMFDRLVRMQHFDLPTRLLDVTTNPLVALYFATEDYRQEGEPMDGKVQALFLPKLRQRYYDSDRVSCIANIANLTKDEKAGITAAYGLDKMSFNKNRYVKRLLWFVRVEKPHFEPRINPSDMRLPVFVRPKMSNRRILAQSGAFIVFGERRLKPANVLDDLKLRRVLIPAEHKAAIRSQLERLGIHASSLFPEIDKAADFIVKRYQNTP